MTANSDNKIGLLLLGLTLAFGAIISTIIISGTLKDIKLSDQAIRIKGYAEKDIISDLAEWTAEFQSNSVDMVSGYDIIENDKQLVLNFLREQGIAQSEIDVKSISVYPVYQINDKGYSTNEILSYNLTQRIDIVSADVQKIKRISSESSSLIKQGIRFISFQPRYFYTKMDSLKIEMLAAATNDARLRAEVMAEQSKSEIGALKYASQGVFQITTRNSTEVSDYGQYDESSIEKSIKAVVTIEYLIDN